MLKKNLNEYFNTINDSHKILNDKIINNGGIQKKTLLIKFFFYVAEKFRLILATSIY